MDRFRKSIEVERGQTDTSLDAERAASTLAKGMQSRSRRRFSDLIEQDRLTVDQRLFRLRDSADRLLASERLAAPSATFSIARERSAADEATRDERTATDAVLVQERRRSDAAASRGEQGDQSTRDPDGASTDQRRRETDEQLSKERQGVDDAISALGATEIALERARVEKVRRQDVFSMVVHELRGPLTVISMGAAFLAESTVEEAQAVSVDIRCSAARMTRLLTDLLDGARIDAGSFCVVPGPEDVASLLQQIGASYAPLFEARQLSFTVDAVAVGSLPVPLDHDRIVQVLSNLLGNAMKFTPAGGTVTLRATRLAGCLEFVVRDSGPGIDEEALPHVFERFWQAGDESREGLGLGLYICKNIVEAHGGRITAESAPGHGATLRFTLPCP